MLPLEVGLCSMRAQHVQQVGLRNVLWFFHRLCVLSVGLRLTGAAISVDGSRRSTLLPCFPAHLRDKETIHIPAITSL